MFKLWRMLREAGLADGHALDAEAGGAGRPVGLAVELVIVIRAHVGRDVFVHRVREPAAAAPAVRAPALWWRVPGRRLLLRPGLRV